MGNWQLALVGPPGTNKVMAGELSRLTRRALSGHRLAEPRKESGGLQYPWDPAVAAVAARYHRTAARVEWEVMASQATRLEPLYDDLLAQMRGQAGWLWDGASISVRVRNVAAFASGPGQLVGVVKNAIVEGSGLSLRVDPADPDVHITVRLRDGTIVVAVDLGGGAMNKRGYRLDAGPAPLRETLAAALVMLARHDSRREPLFDPMAGSGTIAIEAALMAQGQPVWPAPRQPAFVSLPAFAGDDSGALGALFGDTKPVLIMNEVDRKLAGIARKNVAAAGMTSYVSGLVGDFRDVTRARIDELAGGAPGVIVCNPPFGERLGGGDDDELLDLYRDLGDWLVQFKGWRAGFIVGNPDFEREVGHTARIKKPLSARPIKGYFYLYDL